MGDFFERTVVLVIEHSEQGAFGLILNRPSDSTVGEAAPQVADTVGSDHVLHLGGPVDPSAVTAVGEHLNPAASAKLVVGDAGMVDLDDPPLLGRLRLFAGYAGWSAGQLDAEIESEAWFVEPAELEDLFADEEDLDLWAQVLSRKGGVYAVLATYPADPSLN